MNQSVLASSGTSQPQRQQTWIRAELNDGTSDSQSGDEGEASNLGIMDSIMQDYITHCDRFVWFSVPCCGDDLSVCMDAFHSSHAPTHMPAKMDECPCIVSLQFSTSMAPR
jgi:hypothetical protein